MIEKTTESELVVSNKYKIFSEYFHNKIWESNAKYVRDYIYSRRITDQTIKDFQIGWCPSDWSGEFGWWSHRMMVPLIDQYNDYVSFHTRIITKKREDKFGNIYLLEENTNKIVREIYTNGEKKEFNKVWFHGIFEKSCFLYGLNITKKYIEEENSVIVVEGIFDALSLYENGIKNVVAVLGSSLTFHQVCILKRYCDRIIFLFDSDEGGEKGLERANKITEKIFSNTYTLKLPQNYDPHDFVLEKGINFIKSILEEKGLISIKDKIY